MCALIHCCRGHGECLVTDDGEEAKCQCDADSSRYGPYCQFQYGEDPVASIIDNCRDCDGPHKACRDGVCTCEDGYYMFFAICKPNAATPLTLSTSALTVFVVSLIATLMRE